MLVHDELVLVWPNNWVFQRGPNEALATFFFLLRVEVQPLKLL